MQSAELGLAGVRLNDADSAPRSALCCSHSSTAAISRSSRAGGALKPPSAIAQSEATATVPAAKDRRSLSAAPCCRISRRKVGQRDHRCDRRVRIPAAPPKPARSRSANHHRYRASSVADPQTPSSTPSGLPPNSSPRNAISTNTINACKAQAGSRLAMSRPKEPGNRSAAAAATMPVRGRRDELPS